jgi:uncharacterized RDD family membrane protein YckC
LDATSKLTVETPEQIGIEFELAGLGSRLLAALIDLFCMLAFLVVALLVGFAAIETSNDTWQRLGDNAAKNDPLIAGLGAAATVVVLLSVFVVQWGYYIICEMTTGGASPGKRAMGLRVIRDNGLPLGFSQSLLRNLVRAVDFLPWGYGIGLVAVFTSRRGQRLGDLAAGTLVVKVAGEAEDRLRAMPALGPPPLPGVPAPSAREGNGAGDGAIRLLPEERDLVLRFAARSLTLAPEARRELARRIAAPLAQRLGLRERADDEAWLLALARAAAGPP